MTVELNVETWAKQQFGTCELGDIRRTARAVKMATQFAAHASGSTPEQTESWSDCKAAYNLLNSEEVTFSALASDRQISGMGIISSGDAHGYLLHSSLMVDASLGSIIGLAGQTIHYRQRIPKNEKRRQRLERSRESEIWGNVIQQVGAPQENVRFTHVFDRGADNFEVYCHLLQQRTDWVIRAAQLTRSVTTPSGERMQLRKYLRTLRVAGTYQLEVPANEHQVARTATVAVRFGTIGMPRPRNYCGRYAKGLRHQFHHDERGRSAGAESAARAEAVALGLAYFASCRHV